MAWVYAFIALQLASLFVAVWRGTLIAAKLYKGEMIAARSFVFFAAAVTIFAFTKGWV